MERTNDYLQPEMEYNTWILVQSHTQTSKAVICLHCMPCNV